MSLTITASGLADYPPGATFGPRTLLDHEFVWLQSGTARWFADDVAHDLRPGVVALARPGMRDRFEWDPHRTARHAYVHFSGGPSTDGPPVRSLSADDPLGGLLSYLMWLLAETGPAAAARAEQVLQLAVAVFADGPVPADADSERVPDAVRAVGDLLATRWSDGILRPVAVAELAGAASLSVVQLSRIFRSRYGHGPVAAVELLRLRAVEELLSRGNLPIAAIAQRCGFADARHLARRFTAIYGIAPSRFRHAGAPTTPSPLAAAGLLRLYREARRDLPGPH